MFLALSLIQFFSSCWSAKPFPFQVVIHEFGLELRFLVVVELAVLVLVLVHIKNYIHTLDWKLEALGKHYVQSPLQDGMNHLGSRAGIIHVQWPARGLVLP